MNISKNILNLPPYISTPWKNVSSLYLVGTTLKVELTSGTVVDVPNLSQESLEAVFAAHSQSHEEETRETPAPLPNKDQTFGFKIPLNMGGLGSSMGGLGNFADMMQHNSEQMHAAPLPQELLSKIAAMAKAVGMDADMFPKPEPHCNCPHCQMARAIHAEEEPVAKSEPEEEITEEDLRFRDWEVEQTSDKLYRVTNPLDREEHFDVFLGTPIGCTCGEKNCEHMRAVLRS